MNDQRTPESFRGIKVPEHLMNRADRLEYAMWKLAVNDIMDTVLPVVEPFQSEVPCSIDHDGCCQEHWFGGSGPCPVAVLNDFLKLARFNECVWVVRVSLTTFHWCFAHRPQGLSTNRRDLVRITDLPESTQTPRCVSCGRDLVVQ